MLKYINKVSNELKVSPILLEEAWRDFLIKTKRTLEKPEMPKVLIHGFGTFKVNIPKIEYKIKENIRKYKKGFFTREQTKNNLFKLFAVRRRLKHESKTES